MFFSFSWLLLLMYSKMLNIYRTELRSNNCPVANTGFFKGQGQVFSTEEIHSYFLQNHTKFF